MGCRSGLAGPGLSYLICATPRSGSTLLCAALDDTGIAGHPEEHFEVLLETGRQRQPRDYFQRSNDPEVWALLDDAEFRDVLGEYGGGTPSIRPGATPTGARLTSRGWWTKR
jgi:LPS sulfotransferase NodH